MSDPVRRAARSATAPIRDYVNNHFEMLKQEVREAGAGRADELAWQRLGELEAQLAEQSQHEARVLARLGDDLESLTERIADLERVVRRLAEVAAPPEDA